MTAVAEQVESASMSAEGFIGRIPVRNLWLLMLYASDLFRTRGIGKIGLEDSPDDLPDLVAEILAHAVEVRQRRRLSLGYRSRDAVINRVRGRIDVLTTERHQLMDGGGAAEAVNRKDPDRLAELCDAIEPHPGGMEAHRVHAKPCAIQAGEQFDHLPLRTTSAVVIDEDRDRCEIS